MEKARTAPVTGTALVTGHINVTVRVLVTVRTQALVTVIETGHVTEIRAHVIVTVHVIDPGIVRGKENPVAVEGTCSVYYILVVYVRKYVLLCHVRLYYSLCMHTCTFIICIHAH
jgi:hypothetical protein